MRVFVLVMQGIVLVLAVILLVQVQQLRRKDKRRRGAENLTDQYSREVPPEVLWGRLLKDPDDLEVGVQIVGHVRRNETYIYGNTFVDLLSDDGLYSWRA